MPGQASFNLADDGLVSSPRKHQVSLLAATVLLACTQRCGYPSHQQMLDVWSGRQRVLGEARQSIAASQMHDLN